MKHYLVEARVNDGYGSYTDILRIIAASTPEIAARDFTFSGIQRDANISIWELSEKPVANFVAKRKTSTEITPVDWSHWGL